MFCRSIYREAFHSMHFHIVVVSLSFQLNALYSWIFVLFTKYPLHVSALTLSSSGRTLITSKPSVCRKVVTLVELQSTKYIIYGFFFRKLYTVIKTILFRSYGLKVFFFCIKNPCLQHVDACRNNIRRSLSLYQQASTCFGQGFMPSVRNFSCVTCMLCFFQRTWYFTPAVLYRKVSAWLYEIHTLSNSSFDDFLYKNVCVRELNKVCLQGKRPYLVRFWIWAAVIVRIDSLCVWRRVAW